MNAFSTPPSFAPTATTRAILSVSQLNQLAKSTLEDAFGATWISGEISNLSRPHSGHIYFTLKDDKSQVRCALFRTRRLHIDCELETGMQVLVYAKVSLYAARGDYQLIVEHAEEAGQGALLQKYEALKKKLQQEGLFDLAHKKPLPRIPKCLGVITSATGAAVQDVLSVLKKRYAGISVIIYPSLVQGDSAASSLINAITTANARKDCDVLLLTRGGGSLEDLWSFNDEQLARTIYQSALPLVSAIGHEVDFTIADFVADVRAPTPSAAAELISPDKAALLAQVTQLSQQLTLQIQQRLQHNSHQLLHLQKRLRHPGQVIQEQMQRLDELALRLERGMQQQLFCLKSRLQQRATELQQHNPLKTVNTLKQHTQHLQERLQLAMTHRLASSHQAFQILVRTLESVSPLATLGRGYALVRQDKEVITSGTKLNKGDAITVVLQKEELDCEVKAIRSQAID